MLLSVSAQLCHILPLWKHWGTVKYNYLCTDTQSRGRYRKLLTKLAFCWVDATKETIFSQTDKVRQVLTLNIKTSEAKCLNIKHIRSTSKFTGMSWPSTERISLILITKKQTFHFYEREKQ